MKNLKSLFHKYSIGIIALFGLTVAFLLLRGNAARVVAEKVESRQLVQAVYATGAVEPLAEAALSAEVSGQVSFVGALEGESVRQGQVIVRLESEQVGLAVREARAAYAAQQAVAVDSRRLALRKRNLFREGAVSRQELDDAERSSVQSEELLQQRALQLKMREEEQGKLAVVAPFAGRLTLQSVRAGDNVTMNSMVARVVDTSAYLVGVEVDELDIPRIRTGQKAIVAFDAYPSERFSAVVSRIVPRTDRVTKTSKIVLTMDRPPVALQAGMSATANIIYMVRDGALLIGKGAVVRENGRPYVWLIQKGLLKKQAVRLGDGDVKQVEVRSGLKSGDLVVSVPEGSLHEGMEVELVDRQAK